MINLLLCYLVFSSFTLPYKGSGKISESYIRHKLNSKYIFRLDDNNIRIFLRARSNDVSKAHIVINKNKKIRMNELGSTRGKQYFFIDLEYKEDEIEYYFILEDGKARVIFDEQFKYSIPKFSNINKDGFESLVWYHIDVDKFRNGYPYNPYYVWNNSWSLSEEEKKDKEDWYFIPFKRGYGGDIDGIIEKLDYLQELGVDVLLLNSIFKNSEDGVIDHNIIDENIIGKNSFEDFVSLAHDRGLKVVIEFPLNVSLSHKLNNAAESLIDNRLNLQNEDVKKYISKALSKLEDAKVDGIMVDPLLDNEELDTNLYVLEFKDDYNCATNFKLFADVLKVLKSFSPNVAASMLTSMRLNSLRSSSSIPVLSSIYSERAYSAFINYDQKNNRPQENNQYKRALPSIVDRNAVNLLKISFTLLATYFDSFLFAYGDEQGLWGGSDPDSRRPMVWKEFEPYEQEYDSLEKYPNNNFSNVDKANKLVFYKPSVDEDLNRYVRNLLSLKKSDLFKKGNLSFPELPKDVKDNVLVYYRTLNSKAAIIIINLSDKDLTFTLPLPYYGRYLDKFNDKEYEGSAIENFRLSSFSSVVLSNIGD